MTSGEAATNETRRPSAVWSRTLLAVAAIVPAIVILAFASDAARPLFLAVAFAAAFVAWSVADVRAAALVAVLLATFVDYAAGTLALELAVLFAWLAWVALLLLWRSAWKGWVLPPSEMIPALGVWLGVCGMGIVVGLLRGNGVRNLGLEVAAALWPVLALGVAQVFGRRSLSYALVGLTLLGLIHTGFGLAMLHITRQRLGGIYFTTVTGIAAVVLWTAAFLAPSRRARALCLVAMIPMLLHLLFSFTRGYWLGCLAGLATATGLGWRNLGRFEPGLRPRRLLLLPALLLVGAGTATIAVLYFGGSGLLEAVGGRFESSFSTEASRETLSNVIRLAEYDRAIDAALRSPAIGAGFGATIVTRDPLSGTTREQWFVHNYYLLLWLKLGVVGLLAFAFLIGRFVGAARREAREEPDWLVRTWSIAAIAVTIQVLVILLTNYSLADVNTAAIFAYVWGVFWAVRARGPAARAVTSSPG